MKKNIKLQMEAAANRKATIVILIISIAIMCVIKKYGKEQKD